MSVQGTGFRKRIQEPELGFRTLSKLQPNFGVWIGTVSSWAAFVDSLKALVKIKADNTPLAEELSEVGRYPCLMIDGKFE